MDNKSIDDFFNSLSKDELKERWEKYNKYSEGGEEIPDPTAQLKADKEELLEALKETNRRISIIKSEPDGIVRETMIDMLPIGIESLIQKHKQ